MFGRRFLGGRRGGLSGYGRGGRRGTGTFAITKGNETPKPILKGTMILEIRSNAFTFSILSLSAWEAAKKVLS